MLFALIGILLAVALVAVLIKVLGFKRPGY